VRCQISTILLLACIPAFAEPVRVAAVKPFDELAKAWGAKSGFGVQVQTFGQNDAIRQVAGGKFDVALFSDPVTPGQRQMLGVKPGNVPQIEQVGWEAVTAIVHPANSLPHIKPDQLQAIFGERESSETERNIESWASVQGADSFGATPIFPIAPLPDTPAGQAVQVNVLGRSPLRKDCEGYSSDAAIERAVASATEAIGLVYRLRAITLARALPVLASGKTEPATPTSESLSSGDYPLGRGIWLVASKRFYSPHPAASFRSFALSPEGQQEVARLGLHPLR
jgi:ABC-type phosphate transport system substrate-binding protein